jgi:hypothetical protein
MNIRCRVINTSIAGYYHTTNLRVEGGGIFSSPRWEDRKIYVPSREEEKRVLEYLNPKTEKWEPVPEKHEYVSIDAPIATCE